MNRSWVITPWAAWKTLDCGCRRCPKSIVERPRGRQDRFVTARKVIVVGAGIGGLTAAIALHRDGHDVTVLERARELTETGAGIGLWPNALRALDEIGVAEAMEKIGAPFSSTATQTKDGRRLSGFDPQRVLNQLGRQPIIAHRADVQAVLLGAAADVPLRLNTPVAAVRCEPGGTLTVIAADGAEMEAGLVVGADGVNSVVRAVIDKSEPRVSPLLSWRAVVTGGPRIHDAWLSIGAGHQFLATPLPRDRVYVAGLLGPIAGQPAAPEAHSLGHAYAGWHDPIATLLNQIEQTTVRWDEVCHRPAPRVTVRGNVVLIGDAAHPMTPDLGQGGCQAIEDAITLAAALRHTDANALTRFERARRRRVRLVVNNSRRVGQVLAARSPVAVKIRNTVMPAVPQAVSLHQVAAIASVHAFERNLAAVTR
jgi:2-polyprenyl-6-methoxyphenol hydroxylase-like FAD-dependent oxidoreductase